MTTCHIYYSEQGPTPVAWLLSPKQTGRGHSPSPNTKPCLAWQSFCWNTKSFGKYSLQSPSVESFTSNVTGRHWGPKRKLGAGYRTPSLKRTSCCDALSSSSVVSRAFSALCVYSKFAHHPRPIGYLCVKFTFFCGKNCWASPWRKSRTHSINQSPSLFDAPGAEAWASEHL